MNICMYIYRYRYINIKRVSFRKTKTTFYVHDSECHVLHSSGENNFTTMIIHYMIPKRIV